MRDLIYDLLHTHARQLVVLAVLVGGASVPLLVRASRRAITWGARALLLGYVALALAGTLSPQPVPPDYARTINLVPGHLLPGLLDAQSRHDSDVVLLLVTNLLLLAPLGVLVPVAIGLRVRGVASVALALSVFIEAGQYLWVPGRTCDIDDVVCNVLGATLVAWGFLAVLDRCGIVDEVCHPVWTRSQDPA